MTIFKFAQKFTTTGVSGGLRIQVDQTNPGDGKGSTPIGMELSLFQWNTNYATTVAGTALVKDRAIVPSEEIEEDLMWIFLFWKPLTAGTYLWLMDIYDIYTHDGTFQIRRDTTSTYHDAFEDGVGQSYDFFSQILGLDSESHEKVLSLGDTFTGGYSTDGGHSGTKINRGSTGSPSYANSIRPQDAVVKSGQKAGRIASGSLVETI